LCVINDPSPLPAMSLPPFQIIVVTTSVVVSQ
jgi:hypothetical protein